MVPEHFYRFRAHLLHLLLQEPLDALSARGLRQAAGVGKEALRLAAGRPKKGSIQVDDVG
jgi:hypothetical protein